MRNSRLSIFFFLLLASLAAHSSVCLAQSAEAAPEMADSLRADGKIWIVVVVLATIFAGIIAVLIRTDRKIARLEKDRRAS